MELGPSLFLAVSIFVYNAAAFLMRKRLNARDLWTTSLFAAVIGWTVDGILDLKLDLYGYFNQGVDYEGVAVQFGIYPAISMVYLNYFPYRGRAWRKTAYIAGWTAYSLAYEWLAIQIGMFYHNGWAFAYSLFAYPVLLLLLLWHFKLLRKMERRSAAKSAPIKNAQFVLASKRR